MDAAEEGFAAAEKVDEKEDDGLDRSPTAAAVQPAPTVGDAGATDVMSSNDIRE